MMLREAYNELLEDNHWMDEETRMVAKEKVSQWKSKDSFS